jgi:type I restriction enzyme S subunit
MMDSLKPYHGYKDSGVPWLEKVPEHWSLLPNRATFAEVKDRGFPDEEMLSVTIAEGVLRQADLLASSSKKTHQMRINPTTNSFSAEILSTTKCVLGRVR